MRELEIYTLTNSKGGCLKTSSSYYLSQLMSKTSHSRVSRKYKRKSKRTLVIDADYQRNLSKALLGENYDENRGGLLEVIKAEDATPYIQLVSDELLLIQANERLSTFESYFENNLKGKNDAYLMLEKALSKVVEELEIDVIIFDTAPALNQLIFEVYAVGTSWGIENKVIIPVPLGKYGIDSISTVTNSLVSSENPNLSLVGLLPTLYDSRFKTHKTALKELKKEYGGLVLDTQIPHSAGLVDMIENQFDESIKMRRESLEPYYKLYKILGGK